MKNISVKKINIIVSIVTAIFWYVSIWGIGALNIENVDWLKSGDCATHLYGWLFYKNCKWTFPIGMIDGIIDPYKLSIVFTDSIPLFAYIFKILSPFLPDTFQYFGLWGLFSLCCSAVIISLIIEKYNVNIFMHICVVSLFILQPCMIGRMFTHTALAGQWILLLAYYEYEGQEKFSNKGRTIFRCVSISLACMIHMYFIPMVVIIFFCSSLKKIVKDRNLYQILLEIKINLLSWIIGLIVLYIQGVFYDTSIELGNSLGYYCLNLNSLINPMGWSRILKPQELAIQGQYEGMGYIGLGVICLFLCEIFLNLLIKLSKKNNSFSIEKRQCSIIDIICVIVFAIIGMGTVVSFNNTIFFRWTYPKFIEEILSIFRSSGRFVWPIIYLLLIILITNIMKYNKSKHIILAVCLIIQIFDLSGKIGYIRDSFCNAYSEKQISLSYGIWNEILNDSEISSILYDGEISKIQPVVELAYEGKYTINDFPASRKNNKDICRFIQERREKLIEGKIDRNQIYITDRKPEISDKLKLYLQDGYFIVTSNEYKSGKIFNMYELNEIVSIDDYFYKLSNLKDCLIIVCARDEATEGLNESTVISMKELGLSDIRGKFRYSYIAIIDHNNMITERCEDNIIEETYNANGRVFDITSAGGELGYQESIKMDGQEISKLNRGLNIIVYDYKQDQIVDSVAFDTYSDSNIIR